MKKVNVIFFMKCNVLLWTNRYTLLVRANAHSGAVRLCSNETGLFEVKLFQLPSHTTKVIQAHFEVFLIVNEFLPLQFSNFVE